jgi:uncharacterized membrane protein YphA (DoxX/SURF4 family)
MQDARLNQSYSLLKIVYGVVPIVAGLDKFTNLLADWKTYLSPLVVSIVPFSPSTFLPIVGIVEIVAGLLVLSKYTRVGAYIVTVWLVLIALQLVSMGRFLDIAVRDLVMAAGAYALGRMAEVREPERAAARAHERLHAHEHHVPATARP